MADVNNINNQINNNQQTAQNFQTKVDIDNLLNSFQTSNKRVHETTRQLQGLSKRKDALNKELDELDKQLNEAYKTYGTAANAVTIRLLEQKKSLEEKIELQEKAFKETTKANEKAIAATIAIETELKELAEKSSTDVEALIRSITDLDTEEAFNELELKLDALKMTKANLLADINRIRSNILEEPDGTEYKAELQEELVKRQKEFIQNIFDINTQENELRRAKGEEAKAPESLIDQLTGNGQTFGTLGDLLKLLESSQSTEAMGRAGKGLATAGGTLSSIGSVVGSMFGPLGEVAGGLLGQLGGNLFNAGMSTPDEGFITDAIEDAALSVGGIDELVNIVSGLSGLVTQIRDQARTFIDSAAKELESYFGTINANLESSAYSYKAISEKADDFLSSSRWVKQTDYLSKIAELSGNGLLRDIETAAILETIKNKTLTSFDTTNDGIQRLIRLNESDYIRQYGIEAQLKKVLNSVFNDSGYLQSMFDSVTSAIMDASTAFSGDTTAFNSIVQTWMGYMYSSGLSSNVITQIAEGINNLGSGNVSALASDESTQRLFLLAMDRAGLDYADILQQGLSLNDTNSLLMSIVDYLDEISDNTESNLVLRSSYANLFNLSVSDMQAIHTLASQTSTIANNAIGSSGAYTQTINALTNTVEANTTTSEQFDNLFENLKYTYGEGIAENSSLYSFYRISRISQNLLSNFSSLGGVIGKTAQLAQRVAAIPEYAVEVLGFLNLIGDASSSVWNNSVEGGLTSFLSSSISNSALSAEEANTLTSILNTTSSSVSGSSSALKTLKQTSISTAQTYQAEEGFTEDEEDESLAVLKEMAKTLMKTKEDGKYAFAVSLEGMNNEVLKSFASIFADEDAMLKTFQGDNKAVTDRMFSYLEDSTSNSTSA